MADSQADSFQSPIVMKVDAPSEENDSNENEANEPSDIGPSICSPMPRPIIQSSVFGNPFTPKFPLDTSGAAGSSKGILRPSQLSQVSSSSSSKPFALAPGKLNPFLRIAKTDNTDAVEPKPMQTNANECINGETPKFVPLITSTADKPKPELATSVTKPAAAPSTTSNFVFGQNLQERVVNDPHSSSSPNNTGGVSSTSDECMPSSSTSGTNGMSSTDDMLFSSAIKETPMSEAQTPSKSLTESAREYEEQRNNKRKYEEVETKTGEEDETNVMQISCKLFAYDKIVSNWQERGRGILRLNDFVVQDSDAEESYTTSRLVFRNSGVHKVILNTKIWAEMVIEQASAKSIRFTAIDTAGEVKVFLVMAAPDEAKHLFKCLQDRRTGEQRRQNVKKSNDEECVLSKGDSALMDKSMEELQQQHDIDPDTPELNSTNEAASKW